MADMKSPGSDWVKPIGKPPFGMNELKAQSLATPVASLPHVSLPVSNDIPGYTIEHGDQRAYVDFTENKETVRFDHVHSVTIGQQKPSAVTAESFRAEVEGIGNGTQPAIYDRGINKPVLQAAIKAGLDKLKQGNAPAVPQVRTPGAHGP